MVQVNGSNKIGVVDPSGIIIPSGYFNIAGTTINNGTMNIGWSTVYNYGATSTISGNGVINLNDVTLATDLVGSKYCYWNTTFFNISGQTINLKNSQISFGSRDGKGSISDVTINCSGGGNYIAINAGMYSNVSGLKIRGFGGGDIIDLGSIGNADMYSHDPKTGILTIQTFIPGDNSPETATVSIDIGLGYDPLAFNQVATYNGIAGFGRDTGIQYLGAAPCYLGGTLIETARGYVAVEEVSPADHVVTYNNGKTILRQVIWTGKTSICASRSPVIVRQHALGANLPFRDLFVTEEHCLFFDGRFVPVRMLVNGHSIVYDKRSENYDVYHIELETHSVISASGALSESFLDTGHIAFEGRETRRLSWDFDSAAPLCTDRAFVEPLFRQIAARVSGLAVLVDVPHIETRAEIALLVNGTTRLEPQRRNGQKIIFSINEPIRSLSILSETASASTVIGPFVDDRRMLGALVGEVRLFGPEGMTSYNTHLERSALTGWHDRESHMYRWTGAQAELTDLRSEADASVLSVSLYA